MIQSLDFDKLVKLRMPMEFQWREQSTNKSGARLVAYITGRQVMSRLDEVFGLNWEVHYREHGEGATYAKIRVRTPEGVWIEREDVGTESNMDPIKGKMSDALKRAAVAYGIGRFLYSMGELQLPSVEGKDFKGNLKFFAATDKNDPKSRLWGKDDVNRFGHLVHRYGLEKAQKIFKRMAPEPEVDEDRMAQFFEVVEVARLLVGDEGVNRFLNKVAPRPYTLSPDGLLKVQEALSKVSLAARANLLAPNKPEIESKIKDAVGNTRFSLNISSSNPVLALDMGTLQGLI